MTLVEIYFDGLFRLNFYGKSSSKYENHSSCQKLHAWINAAAASERPGGKNCNRFGNRGRLRSCFVLTYFFAKLCAFFFLTGLLIWLIYSFFETIYLNPNFSFFFSAYRPEIYNFDTDMKLLSLAKHHCTEVRFASFLSVGFMTAIVVDPPKRKLTKRISVHWLIFLK